MRPEERRSIMLLPPEVADAIAAGEVVERPASVVKELVENSLDAGARSVVVEISGAGRTLVRVADDGAGIPAGELALAFTRHATSKLATVDELSAIRTLGFRGEALASIAAVADVVARSRGRLLRVRAGEVLEDGPAAPSPGTVVEVRDLFWATPARLKFLKSDAAENAAAARVVIAAALAHPEVAFRLTAGGRTQLSTPGDGDLLRVAAAVWGRAVAPELLPIDLPVDPGGASVPQVRGLVSQPRLSRGNRDAILLSVNRRPISSRSLTHAVEDSYRGSLERGRYPIAVVDLGVEAAELDVNVHPTKREVRFHQEGSIFAAVQRAVRAALDGGRPFLYSISDATRPAPGPALAEPPLHLAREAALVEVPAQPSNRKDGQAIGHDTGPLRPVGQVQDGYLVAEGEDGLVLVDQHAAHERVLYNRFLDRLSAGGGASQAMILPDVLDLEPRQMAALGDHRDRLASLGFEIEDFGPRTARVMAAPAELQPGRVAETVAEMLAALAEGRDGGVLERTAAILACHAAVRFGDRLDASEQRSLLEQLERAPNALTCPHGRPTRVVLGWQDMKRHFRRNY